MDKPIIGMVHSRPLPGSLKHDPVDVGMDKIISTVLGETAILEQAGVDGVQVENTWGIPYLCSESIGYETAAVLAVGIHAVHDKVSIPVGAGCHMNGVDCAMACAVAAGANWIRVFEWCNTLVSQSSFVNAMGANMSRMRNRPKTDQILALCNVSVKHGSHYTIRDRSIAEQAMDTRSRDGDAVVVTGFDAGAPPSAENISKCKKSTSPPILIGSGLNSSDVNELLTAVNGATIGNRLKEGDSWEDPVSYDRTKEFMDKVIALGQG